jgi:hypothetical protein
MGENLCRRLWRIGKDAVMLCFRAGFHHLHEELRTVRHFGGRESSNNFQMPQSTAYQLNKLQKIKLNTTIIVLTRENVEETENVWWMAYGLNKKQTRLRTRGTSTEIDFYWQETRRREESMNCTHLKSRLASCYDHTLNFLLIYIQIPSVQFKSFSVSFKMPVRTL